MLIPTSERGLVGVVGCLEIKYASASSLYSSWISKIKISQMTVCWTQTNLVLKWHVMHIPKPILKD